MKDDIKLLKKEFKRIKSMGIIESLRRGSTGVGYTFETLLNKKEDHESKPDFGSVEIKCKLGYSKSNLTLFNCVPTRQGVPALQYLFEKYGYRHQTRDEEYKLFEREIFSTYAIKRWGYEFKLKVDYYLMEVALNAYNNNIFVEKVCAWNFKILERKLKNKLTYMALVEAYPYKRDNKQCYKYVKMNMFKLRGFFEFLQLIERDKVYVSFYLREAHGEGMSQHGVAFKIKKSCLEELFWKYRY